VLGFKGFSANEIAVLEQSGSENEVYSSVDGAVSVELPETVWIQESYPLSPQKRSKESTETLSLLKTGKKVVEVGWVNNKVEDNNSNQVGSKLGTTT
jgi:hypothetical protein